MKTKFLFLTLLGVVAFSSCNEDLENFNKTVPNFATSIVPETADDPSVVTQSNVANIVKQMSGKMKTRSNSAASYTVQAIDNGNTPLMYVVNFENNDGFIIISATKDYYPILAYSDTGNFDMDNTVPGVSEWQGIMMKELKNSHLQPEDSVRKIRRLWSRYDDNTIEKMKENSQTRSLSNDELWELRMVIEDSITSWNRQGFGVHDLSYNFFDTEQEYQEMVEGVHYGMYPEYIDNYQDLAVIVSKSVIIYSTKVDNFVLSTWDQGADYNKYFPFQTYQKAPAGCGPVATAQVMRYYCHPQPYNWEDMPLNYASDETAKLLFDIAENSYAKYSDLETTTNFNGTSNALSVFSYTFKRGTDVDIEANCLAKMPIITRGQEKNATAGHAWVISGYDYEQICSQYEIWAFTGYRSFGKWNTYQQDHYSTEYQYMNWGWGGRNNGFFYAPFPYTELRDYIYDIKPLR